MSIEVLINYILVSAVIVAIPGPNIILTINDSINYGFRNSLMTILGIVSGMAFLFVLSLAGVTSLLAMFSSLFSVIKWVGVCYLLYLGISQIIISFRSNEQTFNSNSSKKNFFSKGFLISVSNPKGLIFAGAFFPQFFDKNSGMIHQAVVLVAGFLVISLVIHIFYALCSHSANQLLRSESFKIQSNRISGLFLILFGIGLALTNVEDSME